MASCSSGNTLAPAVLASEASVEALSLMVLMSILPVPPSNLALPLTEPMRSLGVLPIMVNSPLNNSGAAHFRFCSSQAITAWVSAPLTSGFTFQRGEWRLAFRSTSSAAVPSKNSGTFTLMVERPPVFLVAILMLFSTRPPASRAGMSQVASQSWARKVSSGNRSSAVSA